MKEDLDRKEGAVPPGIEIPGHPRPETGEQIRGNQVRYFSPAKRRLNPAHRPGFLCAQMDISMWVSMDTHMEMSIKSKVSKLDGSCT